MVKNILLECRELTKMYVVGKQEVKAVDRVNLQVNTGEFVTVLGHSGSGKTTLLSMIGGLTRPDQGEVLLHGRNPWVGNDRETSKVRNKSIGFIFQFASLIPTLTVQENILLPLSFDADRTQGYERAMELLTLVGLGDKQTSFPGQLSGGQQRRVAIARAFINSPEIILADEPTGDLDEETETEVLRFFRQMHGEGVTFIVVTHNKELHESQSSARVLEMRDGMLSE